MNDTPKNKESRFPSFACGKNRLRSTACHERAPPLVPLASLDLPNRGRRVACGSSALARRAPRAATLAALLALLAACGQTGPLYLPEDGPPAAAPATDETAPPLVKEDDEDDGGPRL